MYPDADLHDDEMTPSNAAREAEPTDADPSFERRASRGKKLWMAPDSVKPKIIGHHVIQSMARLSLRPAPSQSRT
jgi:hypothetical protein